MIIKPGGSGKDTNAEQELATQIFFIIQTPGTKQVLERAIIRNMFYFQLGVHNLTAIPESMTARYITGEA